MDFERALARVCGAGGDRAATPASAAGAPSSGDGVSPSGAAGALSAGSGYAAGDGAPPRIGTLGEKMWHATLKWWIDENPAHHEIPLPEGPIADIYDGARVTEIQTANFSGFRPKLQKLLEHYPVTVVHPLVARKWVVWIDPATGEASAPRRSPRVGGFADAGKELIYLLPCLRDPQLTVRLVLCDVEERRLADGWGRDGKRGSHRVERIPRSLVGERTLTCPADYAALIPEGLATPFTASRFGRAAHQQGRTLSGTLKVLTELGVLTRRKEGREYFYERVTATL